MLKNTLIWLFLLGFSQASELELQKEQIATLTNELARLCPILQKSIKTIKTIKVIQKLLIKYMYNKTNNTNGKINITKKI